MLEKLLNKLRPNRLIYQTPNVYWNQAYQEMRERHAREVFARIKAAGAIVTDTSEVDGIRYGDLQHKEQ